MRVLAVVMTIVLAGAITMSITSPSVGDRASGLARGLAHRADFGPALRPGSTPDAGVGRSRRRTMLVSVDEGDDAGAEVAADEPGAGVVDGDKGARRAWLRAYFNRRRSGDGSDAEAADGEAAIEIPEPRPEPVQPPSPGTVAPPSEIPIPESPLPSPVAPSPLPPYAARNSFYHQPSYQCKPTGSLRFEVPRKVRRDGSLEEATGGFPTVAAAEAANAAKQAAIAACKAVADTARAAAACDELEWGASGEELPALDNARLQFGDWSMAWPRFVRPAHERWFASYEIATWRAGTGCPQPPNRLGFCEASYVNGGVSVVHNVSVAGEPTGHDCGQSGALRTLIANGDGGGRAPVRVVDTLAWVVIPATWTPQHWMENTLPKLAQLLEYVPGMMALRRVSATQELLLDRFPIVAKVYEHMGWAVFDERAAPIAARTVLYACNAPPMHPYLWQQGQQHVLRVAPRPMADRTVISYCGRTRAGHTENAGRRVLNEDAVLAALRAYTADGRYTVEEFDHRQHMSLPSLIDYFATVRLFIGPHGGCLTNVVYLGCNSAVVELFPLVNGIRPPLGHPGMMMYMQSSFLEQDYFMLPVTTTSQEGDMTVPIDELRDVLTAALGAPPP